MTEGSRTRSDEFRREGLAAIKTTVNVYRIHKWYAGQLESYFNRAVDQMETALAVGKVMQDMLLEYMPAKDLSKELNRRMLEVRTTGSGKADYDGQMSVFKEEGGKKDGTSGTAAGIQKPQA